MLQSLYYKKNTAFIATCIFLLVQFAFWAFSGTHINNEAEKYIREANSLYENGYLTESKFILYTPIIVAIYISKLLHLGYGFVIVLQIFIAGLAFFFFQKALRTIADHRKWFIGVLLYLVCFPLHQWNFYLYSDSFFFSFITILVSNIIIFHHQNKWSPLLYLLILAAFVLLFTRPVGIFFSVSIILLLWVFFANKRTILPLALSSIILLLIAYFTLQFAFSGNNDFNLLKPYLEAHIICFVPSENAQQLTLQNSGHVWDDFAFYVTHNFTHFGKLILKRIFSFLNPYRSHYSAFHNLVLISYFCAVYLFLIGSLRAAFRYHKKIFFFLLTIILIYTLGIVLQCDDWSNRFVTALLPLFIILGSCHKKIPGK